MKVEIIEVPILEFPPIEIVEVPLGFLAVEIVEIPLEPLNCR